MQRAKRLIPGDTVALVNPAGMPPERFRKCLSRMKDYILEEGVKVKQYLAPADAGPKELATTFTAAWTDHDVSALLPVCGSELIYDVIPHLRSKDLLRPVIFCGSSTLSALSLWIMQQTETITFFGPHLPFIHLRAPQRENEFTIQSFWDMLMWKKGRTKRITTVHERHHFFQVNPDAEMSVVSNIYERTDFISDYRRKDVSFASNFSGILHGRTTFVTLGVLTEMLTRNLLAPLDGCILFTEIMEWRLDKIEQVLTNVLLHPLLAGIHGVYLTSFTERTDRSEKLFLELLDRQKIVALCERLSTLIDAPVIYGFPIGHCAYKLTLPQGIDAEVDLGHGSLVLHKKPLL